jgi:hypothetical protein
MINVIEKIFELKLDGVEKKARWKEKLLVSQRVPKVPTQFSDFFYKVPTQLLIIINISTEIKKIIFCEKIIR